MNRGFDRFYGYNCQRHARSYYPDYLWSDRDQVLLATTPRSRTRFLTRGHRPRRPKKSYEVFKGKDYASDRINERVARIYPQQQRQAFLTLSDDHSSRGSAFGRRTAALS